MLFVLCVCVFVVVFFFVVVCCCVYCLLLCVVSCFVFVCVVCFCFLFSVGNVYVIAPCTTMANENCDCHGEWPNLSVTNPLIRGSQRS